MFSVLIRSVDERKLCQGRKDLFCTPLNTITTAADVLGKITLFFEDEKIQWENSYGICEDSLLSM
jgi:hypothetical protein